VRVTVEVLIVVIAALCLVYLFWALIRPEKF
jgi:K+-transporting ATPase KdpF subunit